MSADAMAVRRYEPKIHNDGSRSSGYGRGTKGFWNKVRKTDTCWLWSGYLDPDGYGKFCTVIAGFPRTLRPHRYAYEMEHGPVPEGLVLMHACDVRACVRPDHLKPGTQKENIHDAMRKGRHNINKPDNRGEMSGRAKLRNEDVQFIRAQAQIRGSVPLLAKLYGISKHTVAGIKYRNSWKHLRQPSGPLDVLPLAALRALVRQRAESPDIDDLAGQRREDAA